MNYGHFYFLCFGCCGEVGGNWCVLCPYAYTCIANISNMLWSCRPSPTQSDHYQQDHGHFIIDGKWLGYMSNYHIPQQPFMMATVVWFHWFDREGHTCLSIWFSFCKVDNLSSSSEFFTSNPFTLVSSSVKYAFFLSLACCAETLFLSSLFPIFCSPQMHNVIYQKCQWPHRIKRIDWEGGQKSYKLIPLQPPAFFVSWTSASLPLTFPGDLSPVWAGHWTRVPPRGWGSSRLTTYLWYPPDLFITLQT